MSYQIYLVGGAVRDQLLGLPVKEKDWVVIGASPEEMIKQGYRPVGKDFPVFLHPETSEEYALARTERKTAPGYHGFVFHTDANVTLEEDLVRRDLTINAIAQDQQGRLIDPYGGQKDLQQRWLRHVSPAFAEDPVRILRVARFMSRFGCLGFRIAETTLSLMRKMVQDGEAQHLVMERVWQECYKALTEESPHIFFQVLLNVGASDVLFPDVGEKTILEGVEFLHKVKNSFYDPADRWSAFCFALSKNELSSLAGNKAIPKEFHQLAFLLRNFSFQLINHTDLNAEQIVILLQKMDVLRKIERFERVVNLALVLAFEPSSKKEKLGIAFWQGAVKAYKKVDIQALVKQGYQKAELGSAIAQERLNQLQIFLTIKLQANDYG